MMYVRACSALVLIQKFKPSYLHSLHQKAGGQGEEDSEAGGGDPLDSIGFGAFLGMLVL